VTRRILHDVIVIIALGYAKDLTWTTRSISKVAQGWQISAGYWQKTSIPLHVSISIGLLDQPHIMVTDSPQNKQSKRRIPKLKYTIYDLALKFSNCHTMFCWSHRPAIILKWGVWEVGSYIRV
jgi:hypothetical protein